MPAARPDLFTPVEDCAHVALAVSGGSDSVGLMHHAARWVAARRGRPQLSVLTVDHGLRVDSHVEARQVAGWARALGLPHTTLLWAGPKPMTGIQARARQARYDLMAAWCMENGVDALLTAHTLDDQAETVIMRLARTSSIDSIAGIPADGEWNGVRVYRPLLGMKRADLRDDLSSWGQAWIDDPSNEDERFERVQWRRLLPELSADGITPDLLAGLATRCRVLVDEVDRRASAWIAERVTGHPGFCDFDKTAFGDLPETMARRVLTRLLGLLGGQKGADRQEIARLTSALKAAGGKQTLGGAVIWASKGRVFIAREAHRIDPGPVTVPDTGEVLWDHRFRIVAPPGSVVQPLVRVPEMAGTSGFPYAARLAEPVIRLPDGRTIVADYHGRGPASAQFLPLNSL